MQLAYNRMGEPFQTNYQNVLAKRKAQATSYPFCQHMWCFKNFFSISGILVRICSALWILLYPVGL